MKQEQRQIRVGIEEIDDNEMVQSPLSLVLALIGGDRPGINWLLAAAGVGCVVVGAVAGLARVKLNSQYLTALRRDLIQSSRKFAASSVGALFTVSSFP